MALGAILQPLIGPIIKPLIDRIPDPNERAREQHSIETALLAAATGAMTGQMRINEKEAEHPNVFVSGWRPAVGWVCAIGLLWEFLLRPIGIWVAFLFGVDFSSAPELSSGEIVGLVMGMLGMGAMRSFEKREGVARGTWNKK